MIIPELIPRSLILPGAIHASSTSPVYDIKFINNGQTGSHGWLDWITLQGRSSNSFDGSFAQFVDSRSVAPGRITDFSILKHCK